jgi:protein-L-isoaspartate(D-aspartate) O-methyltransferase
MADKSLPALRARYAAEIFRLAGTENERVERAFATVPREGFLTPPPWRTFSPGGVVEKVTDDPADLYDDVLVVLDGRQGINNGQPSLHAAWLAAVDPKPGDIAVHVGIGAGYYTAILAELVAPGGFVHAYEIDPPLAAIAEGNLSRIANVAVHAASGLAAELPQANVIYVNAGASAPDRSWLSALEPGGRLIFPWQPAAGGAGFTMMVTRKPGGFEAVPLMMVGFIPLVGDRARSSRPADPDATRSVWLTAERPPDDSATAVWSDVWFSSDPVA